MALQCILFVLLPFLLKNASKEVPTAAVGSQKETIWKIAQKLLQKCKNEDFFFETDFTLEWKPSLRLFKQ